MGLLKSAFDAVTRLHSQPGWIKRPGNPDIYTAMRMSPSNYFRYLAGPSQTIVSGSECIIPVSTIYGQQSATAAIDAAPTDGTWTFSFYLNGTLVTTGSLAFDAVAADIQAAIRLIAGCGNVTVTGDLQLAAFTVSFIGVKYIENISVALGALVGTATASYSYAPIAWPAVQLKRGDRIVNSEGTFSVSEVIPMPDIGGGIIGYRTRYD